MNFAWTLGLIYIKNAGGRLKESSQVLSHASSYRITTVPTADTYVNVFKLSNPCPVLQRHLRMESGSAHTQVLEGRKGVGYILA